MSAGKAAVMPAYEIVSAPLPILNVCAVVLRLLTTPRSLKNGAFGFGSMRVAV